MARARGGEHTAANEAAVHWFMPGPAAGDDRHGGHTGIRHHGGFLVDKSGRIPLRVRMGSDGAAGGLSEEVVWIVAKRARGLRHARQGSGG